MREQRGYSLVEVLAAFAVITLVITISLAAFLERNKRLQQATEVILAYQSLSNEAELRRRMKYSTLESQSPTFVSDTGLLMPLHPYTTEAVVTPVSAGVKHVTLTIRWKEGKREAKLELVRVDTGGSNLW